MDTEKNNQELPALFKIEADIDAVFNEIELNDGEITEEQEQRLAINEDNLIEKLNNYAYRIQGYEDIVNSCKKEIKRLNDFKRVRENRIEKLKKPMLDAVMKYGMLGKTNSFIDTDRHKFYTRNSKAVEIDTDRVDELITTTLDFLNEVVMNNALSVSFDNDIEGIIDVINNIEENLRIGEFKPYTIDDFDNTKINVTFNISLSDLFKLNQQLSEAVTNVMIPKEITPALDKTSIKEAIEKNNKNLTIGSIQNNTNLNIK